MEIYTSYFGNLRKLKQKGIIPIGIAVSPPGWYKGMNYRRFAPTANMLSMGERAYDIHFQRLLAILSPQAVARDLQRMSNGRPIALLCFESNRNECHRLQVANWIETNFGVKVSEVEPAKPVSTVIQKELF